jgi:hypothetical protein
MAQRGRKKGSTDENAHLLRLQLYDEYDRLRHKEAMEDAFRASFLPYNFYVGKLFDMAIVPWSKSHIRRLLMYRYRMKDDRSRER